MIVVRTLGTAEIQIGETRILPTSPRKFALLLYLAVEQGSAVPRATLCDLVFPDQTRKNGQHSLRELVYQFRQFGALFLSDAHGIQLEPRTTHIDTESFLDDVATTESQLQQVARGFLPSYAPEHSEAFAEWFEGFKARSLFRLTKAIATEMDRARGVSDWLRTELAARACLALDGLNESATLAMAQSLAVNGAKRQALALLDQYNVEVRDHSRALTLAPAVLRRRIDEQTAEYAPSLAASPFVGRDHEMQFLRGELATASRGFPRFVSVVGEAGIGKTRLAAEFCRLARLDGFSVAATAVQPHDVHRPYAAFADLLQPLIDMPGALGVSPDSMDHLRRIIRGPSDDVTGFSDSLKETEAFSHTITHAIIDLIDAIAAEATLIVSIDDCGYLDAMSQRVFEVLLRTAGRRRLLLIITARRQAALWQPEGGSATLVELGAIDRQSASRLLAAFVDREELAVDSELAEWFKDTAAGHPLFLENLLAHYSSTHERFSIPPSLLSLLRHRIASLSDRASVALQACSLLGRFATLDTLIATTAMPRFDLVQAVNELEVARLIRSGATTIRPTHSLISDVVSQRMTPMQSRLLHQFCALALEERIGGDQSAALVWECAEHWYAAGNATRATAAIRRCANHAVAMGRAESAAQMLARALSLSDSAETRIELAELLVATAEVAMNAELVLQGLRALDGRQRTASHDDFEFIEFRAHTRVYRDNLGQEERLMRCVMDTTPSPNHRVNAATLLLKYADSCLNRDLSVRTIGALPADILGCASDTARCEFSMIAHAAMHNAEGAVSAARELLRAIDREPSREWLHYSLNAVLALYHGGQVDEAIQIAESRLAKTTSTDLPHLRLLFLTFLWEHSRDVFDDDRANMYQKIIDELVAEFPTLQFQLPSRIACLCVALVDEDYARGRSLVDRMTTDGLLRGGIVRERWRRVAEYRLEQIRGTCAMTDAALQALMEAASQGLVTGGVCETEAATVCHQLLQTGRIAEARDFYQRFVTKYRESRAPLARCVAEVGRRIAALDAKPDLCPTPDLSEMRVHRPGRSRGNHSQRSDAPFVARGRE